MSATITKTKRGSVVQCQECGLEETYVLPTHAENRANGHDAAFHLAEIIAAEVAAAAVCTSR
jgi:hypothetical protein